jgi:hypothetical protein
MKGAWIVLISAGLLSAFAIAERVSVMKDNGATVERASVMEGVPYGSTDTTEQIAFFELHDTNGDGLMTKKEFYYAIMEDAFETLAVKYKKSPLDMEFELSDLNGDKKISLEEWRNVFLQGSEEPQNVDDEANMEEQSIAAKEEPKPPVPPSPASPQAFSGVASGNRGNMHIGSEVTLKDGRKAYLSENATWQETNLFCEEKGVRLCLETELCPFANGMNDAALSADDREKRWAPLTGNMISACRNCRLGKMNSMSGIL